MKYYPDVMVQNKLLHCIVVINFYKLSAFLQESGSDSVSGNVIGNLKENVVN